jgi:hypothetical protein
VQPHNPTSEATTYDRWNRALAEWATAGIREGETVYLAIEDRILLKIRRQFLGIAGGNTEEAVREFTAAVQFRCLRSGEHAVDLWDVGGTCSDGLPRCVGFLGAMVLAAYRMRTDWEDAQTVSVTDRDYFTRLREILDLPVEDGTRPAGLKRDAPEVTLWEQWNRWLRRHGWQSSAMPGAGRYDKNINYPLSQAILRQGDKARLARWFREQERSGALNRFCDRDLLAVRLRDLTPSLPSARLRDLLLTEDVLHYDAVVDAAAELYDAIDWDLPATTVDTDLAGPRRLQAGLYRTEDFITGVIEYWLYPKRPRRWQGGAMGVEVEGRVVPLREQRQRTDWFEPLWPVPLAGEYRYRVVGDYEITELVLPNREFWILVHDPDDEASPLLASWAAPSPGQTYLLLCQEKHEQQLRTLRNEQLLNWAEVVPIEQGGRRWLEYRECQAESSRWTRILPEAGCMDLVEALRPVARVNIVFEGGLRVPGQSLWLEGHQPNLRLYRFGGSAELRVFSAANQDQVAFEGPAPANQRIQLPALVPGEYLIEAKSEGGATIRRLRIVSWDDLPGRLPENPYGLEIAGIRLRGADLVVEKG